MAIAMDRAMAHQMPASLCWFCKNSVPSSEQGTGCDWSRAFKPIDGWVAIPILIKWGDTRGDSFRVVTCPQFCCDVDFRESTTDTSPKWVIELKSGQVFAGISQAAKKFGIHISKVSDFINGKRVNDTPYEFRYVIGGKIIEPHYSGAVIKPIDKTKGRGKPPKAVIELTTRQVYKSTIDAADKLGDNYRQHGIAKACISDSHCYKGMRFMYLNDWEASNG